MQVNLECGCGNRVSGVADGDIAKATSLKCAECEAMWALTITNIRGGDAAR